MQAITRVVIQGLRARDWAGLRGMALACWGGRAFSMLKSEELTVTITHRYGARRAAHSARRAMAIALNLVLLSSGPDGSVQRALMPHHV
jgi:hypothetical protein